MRCTRCRCRCKCTVQVLSHDTDTDTGRDVDACLGEILPAPSCVLFTMFVHVVDMLVDIVDMCGFVLRHEYIVDQ